MSDNYINGVFDSLKELREIKDGLMQLANSFSAVGNHDTSIKLGTWANDIENCTRTIQSAVSGELKRRSGGLSNAFKDEDFTDDDIKEIGDVFGSGGGLGG